MNFCRKRLGGGLYLLPKFRCGTYVFKYSEHNFLKTQNNISTVILIAENRCDPHHLQGRHILLWHAEVGVLTFFLVLTSTDWLLSY